jgi:hypothetical protein
MTQQDFENIAKLLKENSNCVTFIKDYLLRFRFADLASHTKTSVSYIKGKSKIRTTEQIVEHYAEDSETIIKEYEEEVKRICDKNHIQEYCENDQLLLLKEELDNAKTEAFKKIIKQYNSIDSYEFTSGVPSDFMLYPFYLTYITSEEFVYDTENPYIIELFDLLTTYLNVRSKIELNKTNIEALITEFNKMCDAYIKKYWNKTKKDYFSEIKEIFQYDFYTDSDTELIQAKINDENRVTLFSKVLDYLKVLTNYVEPLGADEKYADMDTDTILNMGEVSETAEEKENSEKLKNLKRIALMFVALKRIESDTITSYFSEYIDNNNLKNALTLKKKIESSARTIDEIATSTATKDKENKQILKKYTGALEGVTKKEAEELRKLCDKIISWYNTNNRDVEDGTAFAKFNQADWSGSCTVIKDDIPHDFYFIEEKPSSSDEMRDALAEAKGKILNKGKGDNILKDYEFGEDTLRTEYGINSYRYWLRYCTIATLVNCMLPMYWATGILITGAPLLLPIIFIPILVMSSRVILVLGIGLCGIIPMPMILLMNVSDIPGFTIPILNTVVDMLKGVSAMVMSLGQKSAKEMIKAAIKKEDDNINKIKDEIKQLNQEITNLKNGVGTDMETLRALRKKNGEDTTSKGRKNKDSNRKKKK